MDILSLVEQVSWHEHASVVALRREDGNLVIELETGPEEARCRLRLDCIDTLEVELTEGHFEELGYFTGHPLLLQHDGTHAELFFSSAPTSPGEVFLAAHEVVEAQLQGWRDPRDILCHSPAHFAAVLGRGHGMLARGPEAVIRALERRLASLLDVNAVCSRRPTKPAVVLTVDGGHVVCGSVLVTGPAD